MPMHRIQVTQVCRVTRIITVEREGDSLADAIEQQQEDDSPQFSDPRWVEHHDLMNEEVIAAPAEAA